MANVAWGYFENLLKGFGSLKAICKGGSWLYTLSGKEKICIPRVEKLCEGKPLPPEVSQELFEEEVLFAVTDRGLVVKEGKDYIFFPEGCYRLVWRTPPVGFKV